MGGDTLWASGYEAYERLTPPFQKLLEGLTAIHSSTVSGLPGGGKRLRACVRVSVKGETDVVLALRCHQQSQGDRAAKRGFNVRRADVEFEHPVVRTHPVTGRKMLFVNAGFTTRIPQLSAVESGA